MKYMIKVTLLLEAHLKTLNKPAAKLNSSEFQNSKTKENKSRALAPRDYIYNKNTALLLVSFKREAHQ